MRATAGKAGKVCKRFKSVGSLPAIALAQGTTALPFSSPVGSKALKPGKYRLTLSVRATNGTAVNTVTLTVTVKAKAKRRK